MCVSPIGYEPQVVNPNYANFNTSSINSAIQDFGNQNAGLSSMQFMTDPIFESSEFGRYNDINEDAMYPIATQRQFDIKSAESKLTSIYGDKLYSLDKKQLMKLIEELPSLQEAKLKKQMIYEVAEELRTRKYSEAYRNKKEACAKAYAKRQKICKEAEVNKQKACKEAEDKEKKACKNAEERMQEIGKIAKANYDSKLISEDEYKKIVSSAYAQFYKTRKYAHEMCYRTETKANENCYNTQLSAYRECNNTETVQYTICKNTMSKADEECKYTMMLADEEYADILDNHKSLFKTIGEDAYRAIFEQKDEGFYNRNNI